MLLKGIHQKISSILRDIYLETGIILHSMFLGRIHEKYVNKFRFSCYKIHSEIWEAQEICKAVVNMIGLMI